MYGGVGGSRDKSFTKRTICTFVFRAPGILIYKKTRRSLVIFLVLLNSRCNNRIIAIVITAHCMLGMFTMVILVLAPGA